MSDLMLNYAMALSLMARSENGRGEEFLNSLVERHNRQDGTCQGPCCS